MQALLDGKSVHNAQPRLIVCPGHSATQAVASAMDGLAAKLKAIAMRQSLYREMLLEGILSIAEGENPRSIELKLQGFTG